MRALVAKGDTASVLDAVDLALTMSVSSVRQQLDYDFLDENAEAASRFFGSWLPRLAGHERMAAAEWAGGQYVLSMVHLDHAYRIGARIVMEALAEGSRETARSLEGFRIFTEGPDAEVAEAVADRFEHFAATVRAMHGEIAAELALLPQQADRP